MSQPGGSRDRVVDCVRETLIQATLVRRRPKGPAAAGDARGARGVSDIEEPALLLAEPLFGALADSLGDARPCPGTPRIATKGVLGREEFGHIGGETAVATLQNTRHLTDLPRRGCCVRIGVPVLGH